LIRFNEYGANGTRSLNPGNDRNCRGRNDDGASLAGSLNARDGDNLVGDDNNCANGTRSLNAYDGDICRRKDKNRTGLACSLNPRNGDIYGARDNNRSYRTRCSKIANTFAPTLFAPAYAGSVPTVEGDYDACHGPCLIKLGDTEDCG
jgi:hypothetical protein